MSVHDMNRNKICDLYDSDIEREGEPFDVEYSVNIDGTK